MQFGLSKEVMDKLLAVFRQHSEISAVRIFGSRAMGNYKSYSDIDLALIGNIDELELAKIYAELDELPTPYQFDIKIYSDITYLPLKEHIDCFSKLIYKKNE